MALFVYVTEQCQQTARDHQLQDDLEKFRDRVEATQQTSLFDPFPSPFLVKKKFGGRQGRLIAELRRTQEHAVIVFLEVLIRGSRDYNDEFAHDPIQYGTRHFRSRPSDEDLAGYVANRTRFPSARQKEDPSGPEYAFLYSAFAHHQDGSAEDVVCESREWVDQVSQSRVANQLAFFCQPCLDALKKPFGLHSIPVQGKHGWAIWILRFPGRLFLLSVSMDNNRREAEESARRLFGELEGKTGDDILRASRRAYPALILADDELWIDLEKETVANMALSPEESAVLESARRSDHRFPLFINGRAGSGKSTILQYLFADLLFFYLNRREELGNTAPPVYLTANGELLARARGFVERLLQSEATFAQQGTIGDINRHRPVFDGAFREFQVHLLSLLPEDARNRFSRGFRVDYARFRRMWFERFERERGAVENYGPDIAWHVIRTYVKGLSSGGYLEVSDYSELPANQITVTPRTFEAVYSRVWTWYQQQLEDGGLWDDQDLARYALESDVVRPIHPAVICDEAQDFTRLELELLFRLNLFSQRNLQPSDVQSVPFAFAGDPFQTLNPTGFRWDAIKASFVEKFIFQIDPARRTGSVDLNYRELQFNYRSTDKIVRFGNQVQAMRKALFDLPELKPQTPWTHGGHSFPVLWFRADDGNFWNHFKKNPGLVVIVPCNEGEEETFVRGDEFLRGNIEIADGVPVNVLSASRAKGCEYPAVVVYGFGEHCPVNLFDALGCDVPFADAEQSLPLQYYINRLYVAVSRPKNRLIVVDTETGLTHLWQAARDQSVEKEMLGSLKDAEAWRGQIVGMIMGDPHDLGREIATDQLANAAAFEQDGRARQDAFLLRQAAQAYRGAGQGTKAKECLARALEAEGQLYEAGQEYFAAGFASPEGIHCLWQAGPEGWRHLVMEAARAHHLDSHMECRWARIITGRPDAHAALDLLNAFVYRQENDATFREDCLGNPVWAQAIDALLSPLSFSASSSQRLWDGIAATLDRIRTIRIPVLPAICARAYYAAGRFPEALAQWEQSQEEKPVEYHQTKAKLEPYPARLIALQRLNDFDEIVNAYYEAPKIALSREQASAVSDALRRRCRFREAAEVAWEAASSSAVLAVAADACDQGEASTAGAALRSWTTLLVRSREWDMVTALARDREPALPAECNKREFKRLLREQRPSLKCALVRGLARSEALPEVPPHFRDPIQFFLRDFLRVKPVDASWRNHVSVFEAGAALERAGRIVDSIAFYEAVENGNFDHATKTFSRQRWALNKFRQAAYLRDHGDSTKAANIEHDLRNGPRAVNLEELEEFPALEAIEFDALWPDPDQKLLLAQEEAASQASAPVPSTVPPDPEIITIQDLRLEFSRRAKRCNVTHTNTMDTAFLKVVTRTCGGDVDFRMESERWICDKWGLVAWFGQDPAEMVTVELTSTGQRIRLDVESPHATFLTTAASSGSR